MTRRQLKRHIRKIRSKRFWAGILLLLAVLCFAGSVMLTEAYYVIWREPDPSLPGKVQVESVARAIALHPLKQEGYHQALDIQLSDGVLDEDEHAQYQTILSKHQEKINRHEDMFATLYRRLAFAYMASYHASADIRLKTACTYLEAVQALPGATDAEQTTINAYLEIAQYYREYVWIDGFLREPTAGEVNDLIRRMTAMLDTVQYLPDQDRLAYACIVAELLSEHGELWLQKVEFTKVTELAAKVEAQLQRHITDPAAIRLHVELTAWCNEVQPWEGAR